MQPTQLGEVLRAQVRLQKRQQRLGLACRESSPLSLLGGLKGARIEVPAPQCLLDEKLLQS